MNKKKILLIVFAIIIVAVGIVTAVVPQKEKEMDPEEFLERVWNALSKPQKKSWVKIFSRSPKRSLSLLLPTVTKPTRTITSIIEF